MRRQLLMAVGMSVLLIATLVPGAAIAADPERFGRVDLKRYPVNERLAQELRQMRNLDRQIMVFVELTRPSVADGIGARLEAGESVSEADRAALRAQARQQQVAVRGGIERLNGRIHATFTDVLNGFRVTVSPDRVGQLGRLAGVKAIHRVNRMDRANDNSARYIRAPQAWKQTGFTGQGVRIAVIDTGINYYHHTFAGEGEPENSADNPDIVEPGTFPTSKVVEGWDFVGDAYDSGAVNVASPDPDPMDCNGHGTHVAGTAAGFGVTADGATYTGAYNLNTLNNTDWSVPPGMAPEALLMAYKVFGCEGGTYVVLDAIERAVQEGADVINMSLGLNFGNGGRIEEIATNNATRAGVIVVAAAGNDGPSAYVTGSPSTAAGAISVAALDAVPGWPSVWIDMPTGNDIRGLNANGDTDDLPVTGELNHFEDNPATPCDPSDATGINCEHLGSNDQDYVFNNFQPGQIAVTHRGQTARISRAQEGQEHGAAAVIMINTDPGFPPFEGPIPGVDIPFIGVQGSDHERFHPDDGGSATISEAPDLDNPGYAMNAPFSSGGFRRYDQLLKPDVIAPGVSVFSADFMNVEGGFGISGTSMASPAVAGLAALVRQANPNLPPRWIKAMIVGTATTHNIDSSTGGDDLRIIGAGVVHAQRATKSKVHIAVPNSTEAEMGSHQASLAFGLEEIVKTLSDPALSSERTFRIYNRSSRSVTYNISNQFATPSQGLNVSVSPSTVTVPAGGNAFVTVTITMSNAAAAAMSMAAPGHGPVIDFDDFGQLHTPLDYVGGRLLLKPTSASQGVMVLRVPWGVVPRSTSNVWGSLRNYSTDNGTATNSIRLRNTGLRDGFADVFQWGLQDQNEGFSGMDIRAAGFQTLPASVCDPSLPQKDRCLVVAINNWSRFSNASENLWVVPIDTNGDGTDDYEIYGVDALALLGALPGVFVSAVFDIAADEFTFFYLATAPTNSSTILLPFAASDIGLKLNGDHDFEYYALGMNFWDATCDDPADPFFCDLDVAFTGNNPDAGSLVAHYNAYEPVISNGDFVYMPPGTLNTILPVWIDLNQYDPDHGHQGWMLVTLDDLSGDRQADLIMTGNVPAAPPR